MSARLGRPQSLIFVIAAGIACTIVSAKAVWLDASILTGILSLISLSAGLSYGQAGILTMAQGAFAALGAYAAGISATRFGLSPYVGLVFALALPAVLAWSVARLVTRMVPLATALATLALGSLIEIIARSWDAVTGGYVGLSGVPQIGGLENPAAFNVLVWAFVGVAVLLYENLMHSAYGRALNTIRHDRMRAIADGVAVAPLLSATLALSAAMAGAGGWLYVHYITYFSPQSLDTQTSISALLMAVVGGTDYILGPVLGTALLNMLGKLLPAQEAQGLFFGGTLILILLVARDGLLGLCARLVALRFGASELPAAVTTYEPEVSP